MGPRILILTTQAYDIRALLVLSETTTEIPLVSPSAAQSGIKLINEFDVASGHAVENS